MKQFFKTLFACLLAIVLFIILAFVSLLGIVAGSTKKEKPEIKSNSVLVIDMSEPVMEQSKENQFGKFSGEATEVIGIQDFVNALQNAAEDSHIKGVYIKLGVNANGWATLQEMRAALKEFKKSEKFVIAYGEVCDQKSYYFASAGDKIFINPHGGIEFNGLSLTGSFYKGTLDKLDIKTEAFHCGKYKGAYEPFKLEKFSEPNRYQLQTLLNDLYADMLIATSEKTKIDTATLASMAKNGLVKFTQDAVKAGLIDAALYGDKVEEMIKEKLGIKADEKIEMNTMSSYASSIEQTTKTKDKIAILYATGGISDGEGDDEGIYSKDFVKEIRKVKKDKNVKAVVLRINSPGGSALASEIIYHELKLLGEKKPIIVSMGNYAASGGYYIACAGDSILADHNTLTGSIGVVGVMFNIGDMMKNKLGVTTDVVKTGNYSDFPSVTRSMSEAEKMWIQSYLDTTYTLFKSRVAEARKMDMAKVEDLAQGHVYSGKLAKELGLVDRLGNLQDAIVSAKSMAKLKDATIVEYPEQKDALEELMNSITGKSKEETAMKKILGEEYVIFKELQRVRSMHGKLQMVLPFTLEIK